MSYDPYASCICGSGKKFKWCCQPVHQQLQNVFELESQGQHEAAMRAIDAVIVQHPTNHEVWGRKAMLLYNTGKAEEAEAALDKAFELFPTYPFGYYLKANMRLQEGELAGGLLLMRKAAEHYDIAVTDVLGELYAQIFNCEMKLNRPIAAHAALELAVRFTPEVAEYRNALNATYGPENPNLPAIAKVKYAFKAPSASASAEVHSKWQAALRIAGTGKLADAAKAFEPLAKADPVEPAAAYNYALIQAWLGNNAAALDALDKYVIAESDEIAASQAWTLAEVLRFGQGMEDHADMLEHSTQFMMRDPTPFLQIVQEWDKQGRVFAPQVDQEQGLLVAMLLEEPPPALTPEMEAKQNLRIAAQFMVAGQAIRIWSMSREAVDKIFAVLATKLGSLIVQPMPMRGPAKFFDVMGQGMTIPVRAASEQEASERIRKGFENYYESEWLQRPLKSLSGVPPIDAVGSPTLRKKLRGVVRFHSECGDLRAKPYDFDRLSRKLGLAEAVAAPAAATVGEAKPDIASLNAEGLAALSIDTLSSAELDLAWTSAIKLDAREIAGKFAVALIERPAYAERADRYPLFHMLITLKQSTSDLDGALDYLNAGEADDCKNNEGKRRNEYELRRGQIHAKRGEFEQANDVFTRLIERVPTELKYRVTAAETMLSARQKPQALKFAQDGLAAATKAQNRDLEGHFKELVGASQK